MVALNPGDRSGGLIQTDFARREKELVLGDTKDGELSEISDSERRCVSFFLLALPFKSMSKGVRSIFLTFVGGCGDRNEDKL
jgi:hypothetical protein